MGGEIDLLWIFLAPCPRCRDCGSPKSAAAGRETLQSCQVPFLPIIILFGSCVCSVCAADGAMPAEESSGAGGTHRGARPTSTRQRQAFTGELISSSN